ncbi:MAG TPA: hypothetical protein VEY93_00075 [Longimicrobium sp.]|nr:hypothetical protein [Longimicrobium sp.]
MNYGRDYGYRNFMDRAAETVRGWFGGRDDYGHDYRGGGMHRVGMHGGGSSRAGMYGGDHERGGWNQHGGYREMGDINGGYTGGMSRGNFGSGYTATSYTGQGGGNRYDAGYRAGRGRDGGDSYDTGGYRPTHGLTDVDWNDRGYRGGGHNRGAYGGRGHDMDRPGARGGYAGTHRGGMGRYGSEYRGGNTGHLGSGGGEYDAGNMGVGDSEGGIGGRYGAYGPYGMERFRNSNSGGVPTGQYYTGYGVGGHRP